MSQTRQASASGTFVRVVAILVGLQFAVVGVWAMVDPRSFFDVLASFPP